MRQAKDSKNADAIKALEDDMAEHEKEDASAISTIKARLHSHRAILRSLQSLPERVRVLEFKAKINSTTDMSTTDDGEDDL
jgi:hypothetical protein